MKKKFVIILSAILVCLVTLFFSACVDTDLSNQKYPENFESMLEQSYSQRRDETDIRIMSFNMLVHISGWGGTPVEPRAKMFTAVLQKYEPDIIAAQEVCSDWHKVLDANISDKYEVIHPKINLFSYNKTPIFYNKETLNLLESGYMSYSVGDDNGCRAVTWGLFEIKTSGKKIIVTDTHLDLIRSGKEDEELSIMNTQADELIDLAEKLFAEYNCPLIACGDYNSQENGNGLDSQGKPLGVFAAADIYEKLAGKMSDIKYADEVNIISQSENVYEPTWDHIFSLGDIKVNDFFILSDDLYVQMSDHFAIIADLTII